MCGGRWEERMRGVWGKVGGKGVGGRCVHGREMCHWVGGTYGLCGMGPCIRECGSVLYLGMAKEISHLPYSALAGKRSKEPQPPKPSMQTE